MAARQHRVLRVRVLALHACAPIVPIGMIDLLRKSIELAATIPEPRARPRPKLDVALVAAGTERAITAAGGVQLQCDTTLRQVAQCDVCIVPALDPEVIGRIEQNRAVVPWLRRIYARGAEIMSACTGSFLLGEAGLLDGRTATTHWAFQPLFAARYPKVHVAPEAIIVDQGRIVTAGGATSFINLALLLVERLLGQDVAWAASRMFLIDPNKSPQSAYAALSPQKDHDDKPILRAQEIIERDIAELPAVEDLARRVALSRRTFVRRFQAATGNSPRGYVQRVRVEAAKRALERGGAIADVAAAVGYEDPVAFRKMFVRLVGVTPADYRARYGPRAAPAWVGRRTRV